MARPKKKKRRRIPFKSRVLSLTEARTTEPAYLDALARDPRVKARYFAKVEKKPGVPPDALVDIAIDMRDASAAQDPIMRWDEVWRVVDVDCQVNQRGREPQLRAAKKMPDKEGTRLCVSNPCFEFWALLHFEKTAKLFQYCGSAIN